MSEGISAAAHSASVRVCVRSLWPARRKHHNFVARLTVEEHKCMDSKPCSLIKKTKNWKTSRVVFSSKSVNETFSFPWTFKYFFCIFYEEERGAAVLVQVLGNELQLIQSSDFIFTDAESGRRACFAYQGLWWRDCWSRQAPDQMWYKTGIRFNVCNIMSFLSSPITS